MLGRTWEFLYGRILLRNRHLPVLSTLIEIEGVD
jgi:hypothetical protein